MGAVRDDKYLHILIQAAGGPKAVPLVALDLVERLPDGHAPALQLDMYHRQAVDQHGHIVAHIPVARSLLVLVDDLQMVVVDVLFVQQIDVFAGTVVLAQHLHMVALYLAGLFHDALVGAGNAILEETLPLRVGEGVVVQLLQLAAQIGDERRLVVDGQVFIALGGQHMDEFLLQRGLALVALRPPRLRGILRHHRTLAGGGDEVVLGHRNFLLLAAFQLFITLFYLRKRIWSKFSAFFVNFETFRHTTFQISK